MRILNILFIAAMTLTAMTQCSKKTSGTVTATQETGQSENDLAGIYTGVLPCADCPGIETTITVHPDNSYEIAQVYTEKDSVPFISSGLIKKGEQENTWVFKSRYNETFYQYEDSALRMLDRSQKEIDGLLEQHYILKKKETDRKDRLMLELTDKKWALRELKGIDLVSQGGNRKPHIIFDPEKNRVHGFAGCNSFFGQYQIEADGSVSFKNMASTKMHCAESMKTETAFMQALHNCNKLWINDNTLKLKDAENNVIAVFTVFEED